MLHGLDGPQPVVFETVTVDLMGITEEPTTFGSEGRWEKHRNTLEGVAVIDQE